MDLETIKEQERAVVAAAKAVTRASRACVKALNGLPGHDVARIMQLLNEIYCPVKS